jgi:hypothetical protein
MKMLIKLAQIRLPAAPRVNDSQESWTGRLKLQINPAEFLQKDLQYGDF